MLKVNNKDTKKTLLTLFWCLRYNSELFHIFSSFPVVGFEQVTICWESCMTFYSFDMCFNVSNGGRQGFTRSNPGISLIFLISHTQ